MEADGRESNQVHTCYQHPESPRSKPCLSKGRKEMQALGLTSPRASPGLQRGRL